MNIKVTCDPVTNIYQLVYVDNSLGLTVGKPYDHLSMWFDYCAVTSRPTRSGEDEDFNDRRPRALSCGYKLSPPPLRIQPIFRDPASPLRLLSAPGYNRVRVDEQV